MKAWCSSLELINWNLETWNVALAAFPPTARKKIESVIDLGSPPPFFDFLVGALEADAGKGTAGPVCATLLETNLVIHAISSPDLCPLPQAIRLARAASYLDRRLDVALFEYLGRSPRKAPEDAPEAEILHVLEVIGAISDCEQLAAPLTKLLTSPYRDVRSIAVKLTARANRSPQWAASKFSDTDPLVRCNLIEGIAAQTGDHVVPLLRKAAKDLDYRVVASGLLGLTRKGDLASLDALRELATFGAPDFRKSATWALAQLKADKEAPPLKSALMHPVA